MINGWKRARGFQKKKKVKHILNNSEEKTVQLFLALHGRNMISAINQRML